MDVLLGIDVGFGEMKVSVEKEAKIFRFRFPASVKAESVESLGLGINGLTDPDITSKYCVIIDNMQYFIGNGIDEVLGSSQTIGTEKDKEDYYILTAGTLGMLAQEFDKNSLTAAVTIGFPLRTSENFREEVVKDLSSINSIKVQNLLTNEIKDVNLSIKVFTLDQGKGAFISLIGLKVDENGDAFVDEDASHYLRENSLIIDIGTNTVNPLFVKPDMKIDKNISHARIHAGVVNVVDEILLELQEKGVAIDRRTVQEEILKKDPEEYAGISNIREIRERAVVTGWKRTGSEVRSIIKEAFSKSNRIDNLIFCGGGAIVFKKFIREEFSQKFNVVIPKDPVMANADGYLLWTKANLEV